MSASRKPAIHVVAGALVRSNEVLIAQRPAGKPLAGFWEFPGGKLDAGEIAFEALVRELREELGVHVREGRKLTQYTHSYAERDVHLELWLVTDFRGEPQSLDDQALRWVNIEQLQAVDLLEADAPMIEVLREILAA